MHTVLIQQLKIGVRDCPHRMSSPGMRGGWNFHALDYSSVAVAFSLRALARAHRAPTPSIWGPGPIIFSELGSIQLYFRLGTFGFILDWEYSILLQIGSVCLCGLEQLHIFSD